MAVGFLEARRDLGVEDESVAIVKMEVIQQMVNMSHLNAGCVVCTHSDWHELYDPSRIEPSPSAASACKHHSMQ